MSLKVQYVMGPTLNTSYFVGTEGDQQVAIRATHLLDPKLHKLADEDSNPEEPKLEVQPDDIVRELEEKSEDLESFKANAQALTLKHASMVVQSASEDAPVMATEPPEKVKVENEPEVAAEEQFSSKSAETESAPKVAKYYARLPKKALGQPEIGLDLQSTVQAQQEEIKAMQDKIKAVSEERDQLKGELDDKKKEDASQGVMSLLSKLSVKDKDALKKSISSLDEKAIGVVERVLQAVIDSKDSGGSKPPAAPAAPKGAPGMAPAPKAPAPAPKSGDDKDKPPVFSSEDNVVYGFTHADSSTDDLVQAWIEYQNSQQAHVNAKFQ